MAKEAISVLVIDTETTGTNPEKDKVVEIAGVTVMERPRKKPRYIFQQFEYLVNPGMNIPPEAMGIHHISDAEVAGSFSLEEIMIRTVIPLLPFVPCAHFAEFDSKFVLLPGNHDWICTSRCARHVYPDAPGYSNQTLRYYLGLLNEPDKRAMPPHRAAPDAWVTAHLLDRIMQDSGNSPGELVDLTKRPILLKKANFGKHRGEEWSKVPKDYLRWLTKTFDPARGDDPDVIFTAKYHLG